MNLRNLFISVAAALLPVAASALTLNINGQNIDVESVDINTTGSTVTITFTPVNGGGDNGGGDNGGGDNGGGGDGGGGDGGGGDGGGGDGGGGDGGGGTGNCGPLPSNVVLAGEINWDQPPGQTRNALGTETKAFRFKTTNNPAYEGQVSTVVTSAAAALRSVWISQCPGGEPLAGRCTAEGNESAVVRWAQNDSARSACHLQTNTEYFVNVRNSRLGSTVSTCQAGSCPFYMNIYHNQRP